MGFQTALLLVINCMDFRLNLLVVQNKTKHPVPNLIKEGWLRTSRGLRKTSDLFRKTRDTLYRGKGDRCAISTTEFN